ncbi:hypothetical protein [Cupriavidus sp. AcVe19-6a]|uniref:hypothetical protein n=1 Tax=Cupriavidus sp. AcVe19-6a TaxID=2821358 RepID=UPI001AE40C4F|nr:hypothetical protein [Cupriavidus sp. AcVe19-6a]MBP0639968.1 hypothetical protein [Cupriavidus sp. AcVe19-6a]
MNSNNVSELTHCLRHAAERVRIANAEGNPILSAWLPEADALLGKLPNAMQAVLAVQFKSMWEEGDVTSKAKLDLESGRVFDIEPSQEGEEYVTPLTANIALGDTTIPVSKCDGFGYVVAAEQLARLKDPMSVKYEPGTGVEVDHYGKLELGIVKADFNTMNVALVDVEGTVYGFHASQIRRTVTSRLLAERYPAKGSMPRAVVHQLYQLRELEVERLGQCEAIVMADLQGLDRLARAVVASMLFEKCDNDTRHALLHDEHPHVRSCAVISQSDHQAAS